MRRATVARNTLALPHINNWDFALMKRVNITERQSLEFLFQATNIFNHAQYVPGLISDVSSTSIVLHRKQSRTPVRPQSPASTSRNQFFSNHPRTCSWS